MASLTLHIGQMQQLKISMRPRRQPINDGIEQPRKNEAQKKRQQRPAPLTIDQGGEQVVEESIAPLEQLRLVDIAVAVFENRTSPNTSSMVTTSERIEKV
jgi:hypothetical protein